MIRSMHEQIEMHFLKVSDVNSPLELCNIIDAVQQRPNISVRALWKALMCQVIVIKSVLWTAVLACWVTPGGGELK